MEQPIDIKAIRQKLGLTLAALGERVGGVHQTTVGRWESGATTPRGPALKALRELAAEAARAAEGVAASEEEAA